MGKIYQGILGGVSSKVGSVVGAAWKGIPVLRVYQPNVSNPKTAAQETVRGGFKLLSSIASYALAGFIKPVWDRGAVRMSGYNAFISANKGNLKHTAEDMFDTIVAGKGKMAATPFTVSNDPNERAQSISWEDSSNRYALPSDKAYVLIVGIDGVPIAWGDTGVTRQTKTAQLSSLTFNPEANSSTTACIYLVFVREDGTVVSDSSSQVANEGILIPTV